MRWGFLVALLITVVVATGVVGDLYPRAQAQDATPTAGQAAATPQAARFRTLASGSIEVLAPGTANLGLGRIVLAPGGTLPFDPADPSAVLVYMGTGELTFRVEAPMTVARSVGVGTPVPTEPEAVEANTEFIMSEGDSALFPPAIAGEVRNDGDQEATVWVVSVALLAEGAATPTP